MGSCMGRCFPKSDSSSSCYRNRNIFSDQENEFHFLVEDSDVSTTHPETNRGTFMSRLISRKKNRYKHVKKKPVLELVEGFWSTNSDSSYSRLNKNVAKKLSTSSGQQGRSDIPLQCLDVRALLRGAGDPTTSSTPVSSLDLEWEHETLPVSMHDPSLSSWAVLPEETLPETAFASVSASASASASEASTTRPGGQSSFSDWSRVSSADSLEWDPVQSPLHGTPPGSIDTDTQQLLNEIERLTDQALRETGNGLNS